jgi:nucleoside-triphosphatase THEP1
MTDQPRVIIITGETRSGKTTLAEALVNWMSGRGLKTAGILARGHWRNDQRSGFDLVDLGDGRVTPLATRNPKPAKDAVTGFSFSPQGLSAGKEALSLECCRDADWIVVDEIGRLELAGSGWEPQLAPLLAGTAAGHIWVVRESLVDPVCRLWNITPAAIVSTGNPEALSLLKSFVLKQ